MNHPESAVLLPSIILFLCFSLTSAVPRCPHNDSVPAYNRSAPLNQLGHGYDRTQTDIASGIKQPLIGLTQSDEKLVLSSNPPVAVPIPCEAKENFGAVSGSHPYADDSVLTSEKQVETKISTGGWFSVVLNYVQLTAMISRMENTLRTARYVSVNSYRSLPLGYVSLPVITSSQRASVQEWFTVDFQNAVDDLNMVHWTDASYDRLIAAFGTHVISRASLGGFITVQGFAAFCDFKNLEKNGYGGAVNALLKDLDIAANSSRSTETQRQTSHYVSKLRIVRKGGDYAAYAKTGNIDKYLGGQMPNGVAFMAQESSFLEIWKLLPESDRRRELLKQAVTEYLSKRNESTTSLPHPDCPGSDSSKPVWLWIVSIVVVLIVLVLCFYFCCRRGKRRSESLGN